MIEKNIFQSWYTTKLPEPIQKKVQHYKTLNPEYEYHLYTDADMDLFVNTHYPGEIAECYNRLNIIVAKVDFWRYLVLYHFGGVYLDMDSSIEAPLKDLIQDDDTAIISAEANPGTYVQWALIFQKNHPILKRTIEMVVDNIKKNRFPNDILRMTGPFVYSCAINSVHQQLFDGTTINHASIKRDTDMKYSSNNVSYRLFGIDYGRFFRFRHDAHTLLYSDKPDWRMEQRIKPLLLLL